MLAETINTALGGNATVKILDPRNDGVHLEAIIISDAFEGVSLLQRHRMVMEPLKERFETDLHALGVKTFTTKEWQAYENRN
ncbi:MAG: BolA/IbaG family iron-sulfur metabolism protein [Simkaniaceae bacterium]|nr:BolA/IbaG family iron-sulfur metabolism protein [Simkaniaceae bacterium]